MSAPADPSDPFADLDRHRFQRQQLRGAIEELATGLRSLLGYRPPLARWCATGPSERDSWGERCWQAGRALAEAGAESAPGEIRDCGRYTPEVIPSVERRVAGMAACDLLAAAAVNDRADFDRVLNRLFAEPDVAAALPEEVYPLCSQLDYHILRQHIGRYADAYQKLTDLPVWGVDSPRTWTGTGRLSAVAMLLLRLLESNLERNTGFPWDELTRWWPPRPSADQKSTMESPPSDTADTADTLSRAGLPPAVRNWLTAHYLSDPTPGRLHPTDPEPVVLVRFETVRDFLMSERIEVLPALDGWKTAGWIDDIMIDILNTDSPKTTLPYSVVRLSLPVGRHRLVGIRRSILSAPTASPGGPPETATSREQVSAAASFETLRTFARKNLKGQERAVVESLCDASGEMSIADLALKDGLGWDDPFTGFRNTQQRLRDKLKPLGWVLIRHDNAAMLQAVKS